MSVVQRPATEHDAMSLMLEAIGREYHVDGCGDYDYGGDD
jgi:hypothetical protein